MTSLLNLNCTDCMLCVCVGGGEHYDIKQTLVYSPNFQSKDHEARQKLPKRVVFEWEVRDLKFTQKRGSFSDKICKCYVTNLVGNLFFFKKVFFWTNLFIFFKKIKYIGSLGDIYIIFYQKLKKHGVFRWQSKILILRAFIGWLVSWKRGF